MIADNHMKYGANAEFLHVEAGGAYETHKHGANAEFVRVEAGGAKRYNWPLKV
jgi:hypothetical protein